MDRDTLFGDIVRQHRQALDLTQAELARRVACATITIRKIEYNSLRPSIQIAERLATSLKIPLEDRAAFVRLARATTIKTPTPSPIPTPPPTPEEIGLEDLSGRAIRGYELSDRIGEGGFGVVYRAVQPLVEREVAVKIILPRYADHPEFIRRFEAEAQLVARLEHPFIVPLYDYWREPGAAFLVMRLMRGGSLHSLLKDGPLALDFILRMLVQVGGALYSAHRMGVIHRDLKPANILLDEDRNTYLADFGVAKNLGNPELTSDTMLAGIIGSPAYVSPEQIRSEPIRPQADIYALGMLLFELLTGRQAFPGPTPIDYAQQHLNQPTPPLLDFNPALPVSLEPVLSRATAKPPEDRYPDISDLVKDFQAAVTAAGVEVPDSILYEWLPTEKIDLDAIENPYKGLRPFQESDADQFYGRETLVQDLLGRLAEENDISRFLAVVGPSGSGKSSAVKAGLIPSLRRGGLPGSEHWFFSECTPGSHPFEELETALLRVAVNPPEHLLSQLRHDERGLLRAVKRILPADNQVDLVLLVDQFEELFTLVEDENTRAAFLESLLTALLDPRSRLRVVITLRADFTDRPLEYVDFGDLLRQRSEFVLPLTTDELELAIIQPAREVGLALEAGLCQRIIRDLGDQPGTLPLLQYTLTELFERRTGRRLTLQAYQDSGGVLGSLGKRAEEIYSGFDPADQLTTRQVFLRLVTLGEGVEDTRRRALLTELEALNPLENPSPKQYPEEAPARYGKEGVGQVLDTFGRARLLSFDRDPLTRGPTVEVAHEALLREWSQLREWLDQSRADIRSQRVLGNAAAEWSASNRDPSFLLRGSRLDQFAAWVETADLALTRLEAEYIAACLAERRAREAAEAERLAREASTERRSRNILRGLVVVMAMTAVVAIVLSLYAFNQQDLAQSEALQRATQQAIAESEVNARATLQAVAEEEAEARGIAEEQAHEERDRAVSAEQDALEQREEAMRQTAIGLASQAEMQTKGPAPETSVLLALEAAENYPYTWHAERALGNSILNNKLRKIIQTHRFPTNVEWSEDGKRILISGFDTDEYGKWENLNARVLSTSSGEELIRIDEGEPNLASWSSDESSILTINEQDGVVKVWDVKSSSVRFSLNIEDIQGWVWANANSWKPWSPDGSKFMVSNTNGMVRIFDALSGHVSLILPGHEIWLPRNEIVEDYSPYINQPMWSPNGDLIAVSGLGFTIIYNADNGQLIHTISGEFEDDYVIFGGWAPSGDKFITYGLGGTIVYKTNSGQLLLNLSTPNSFCRRALWSPDGSRIITLTENLVTVWDAVNGKKMISTEIIYPVNADWSASGEIVAVSGADGLIHVFNVITNTVYSLYGTLGQHGRLLFSSDEDYLLVAGFGNIMLIDLSEATFKSLISTCNYISNPAWSPDGKQFAFASHCPPDYPVKIWDSQSGELLVELKHQYNPIDVSWSPSGDRILVSYQDHFTIWNALNFNLRDVFREHEPDIFVSRWSPDGRQVATGSFEHVMVWDSYSGEEILTFAGHNGRVASVSWSPDGSHIISTGDNGEAFIWDAASGKKLMELFSNDLKFTIIDSSWTKDGEKIILFSEEGYIYVFDSKNGTQISRFFTISGSSFTKFSLSPSDVRVIIGSNENHASVWDLEIGAEVISYELDGSIWPVYSPDGSQVLLGSTKGAWGGLYLYPTWNSLKDLVDYAKECCVVRELTADERQLFGLPPSE